MKLKTVALGLALALVVTGPALAQRGGGGGGDRWELLGEERVGFGQDRDVIQLRHNESFYRDKGYRQLRFVAEGGEVRMRSVVLTYLNGHREEVAFDRDLRPGQEIDLDLRGERSFLRSIEMIYKAKFGISLGGGGLRVNQATIRVFGENARGGPPPRPEPPRPGPGAGRGWDTLASDRFSLSNEEVEMRVGRREGRVAQIRLRSEGERVNLREVRIRFGNGETQVVRMDERLERGQETRVIDVEGDRRFIERVTVRLDPRRRPGTGELVLLGTERGGRDDGPRPGAGFRPRPGWELLGKQELGFRVDRDVIRVGQSEDWFRNRGFDRLHFVAEGNDIHLMAVRVVYMNGYGEDYRIDRLLREGSDQEIELRGRRSFIREIEMTYRARPDFRGRATMSVYGEAPRRR